jgi:hypothetical protein
MLLSLVPAAPPTADDRLLHVLLVLRQYRLLLGADDVGMPGPVRRAALEAGPGPGGLAVDLIAVQRPAVHRGETDRIGGAVLPADDDTALIEAFHREICDDRTRRPQRAALFAVERPDGSPRPGAVGAFALAQRQMETRDGAGGCAHRRVRLARGRNGHGEGDLLCVPLARGVLVTLLPALVRKALLFGVIAGDGAE